MVDVRGSSVLHGASDSGEWGPPMAELIPSSSATSIPFCWQGELDVHPPHGRDVSTPGADLGVLQLQTTWIRNVTDGSNLREEPSLEPDEPRHVLNASTVEQSVWHPGAVKIFTTMGHRTILASYS